MVAELASCQETFGHIKVRGLSGYTQENVNFTRQYFYDSQKRYSFQDILRLIHEFEQCLFQYREYYESEEVLSHIHVFRT